MLVLCVIQKKHWWILSSHKKASIVGYKKPSCGLGKGTILEKRIRVNLLQLLLFTAVTYLWVSTAHSRTLLLRHHGTSLFTQNTSNTDKRFITSQL